MTPYTQHREKMVLFCQSNSRSKFSVIKRGAVGDSYSESAFDAEVTKLGSCAKFAVSINQYNPANLSGVDLHQLINESEMFPFNWERQKISQGYSLSYEKWECTSNADSF